MTARDVMVYPTRLVVGLGCARYPPIPSHRGDEAHSKHPQGRLQLCVCPCLRAGCFQDKLLQAYRFRAAMVVLDN